MSQHGHIARLTRRDGAAFIVSLLVHGLLLALLTRSGGVVESSSARSGSVLEAYMVSRPAAESDAATRKPLRPIAPASPFSRRRGALAAAQGLVVTDLSAAAGAATLPRTAFVDPRANPGEPQSARSAVDDELAAVQRAVERWLQRHRNYPRSAQRAGVQGEVQLQFALDAHGNLLDARLRRASGFVVLDRAALQLLERAAPFPLPTLRADIRRIDLELPIAYRLEGGLVEIAAR